MASNLYTIAELAQLADGVLADLGATPANGRIRERPDVRTLRYYTTLGLLDRPAEMRGRTALYDRRHLEQVVLIKRLQAAGQSLAEIQRRLLGLSAAERTRLAAVPEQLPPLAPQRPGLVNPARGDFWTARPVGSHDSLSDGSNARETIPVGEHAELIVRNVSLDPAAQRQLAPVLQILADTLERIAQKRRV